MPAQFPGQVWNGLSKNPERLQGADQEPDFNDWNQITLELQATQTYALDTGSSGFTNPMTSTGDIIVGGSSGVPSRLGIGTSGQFLTVNTGTPTWTTPTTFALSGAIGVNGKTPPSQASSPGTAAGSDATVINGIITILKNLGFISSTPPG